MHEMVYVINVNIMVYLRDKDHMVIDIAKAKERFPEFAERIGANVDMGAALAEFATTHNAAAVECV